MATDTMNCSSSGIDACGAIVKASSGVVATGFPLLLQGLLFVVAIYACVIMLRSQYNTWTKDSDYTIGDLLFNVTRTISVTLIVLIFITL